MSGEITNDNERTRLLNEDENVPCRFIQARHVLALLAFIGFFNLYCLRFNLSVALVAMVNFTYTNDDEGSECKAPGGAVNSTALSREGEFEWGETTQGIILGSFFYGYILTQIPGGFLADKIGAKNLLGFGILFTSILSLITPLAARAGVTVLIIVRILEGICEGVTFPAMHSMWGQWAPILERSKLAGFTYSGAQLGVVFSMPVSGILCASSWGWPSVFYFFGISGCVWFIIWMCLIHETPALHPRITKVELDYIESSIGRKEHLRIPWKDIFKSRALWAICGGHFANNWGWYTFLTCLPTFLKRILKFNIEENGYMSALPYAALSLVMVCTGVLVDLIRSRKYLSTKNTRKLMTTLGFLIPAGLVIGVSFVGCDHTWVVTLLVLAMGLAGVAMSGFFVNHLDIAPRFSGVLLGITNCIATIPGFLGPWVVGIITDYNETIAGWRWVFFITAGVYVVGAVIYLLLAEGEEQSWAGVAATLVHVDEPVLVEHSVDRGTDGFKSD